MVQGFPPGFREAVEEPAARYEVPNVTHILRLAQVLAASAVKPALMTQVSKQKSAAPPVATSTPRTPGVFGVVTFSIFPFLSIGGRAQREMAFLTRCCFGASEWSLDEACSTIKLCDTQELLNGR